MVIDKKAPFMRHFYFMYFIAVLALSCKKNNTENKVERDFVKGDVLVGIDSTLKLERLFAYVNPLNVTIDHITGYVYTTTMTKDSIPFIKATLNSKSYVNTRGFSATVWPHYQTDIVYNTTNLWNMTLANQQDYIQTKKFLKMTDKPSSTKYMLIKVPIGQEIYWKNKFKTFSWVQWADLNEIGGIELYGN
jgi:hypothetical protein